MYLTYVLVIKWLLIRLGVIEKGLDLIFNEGWLQLGNQVLPPIFSIYIVDTLFKRSGQWTRPLTTSVQCLVWFYGPCGRKQFDEKALFIVVLA